MFITPCATGPRFVNTTTGKPYNGRQLARYRNPILTIIPTLTHFQNEKQKTKARAMRHPNACDEARAKPVASGALFEEPAGKTRD